MIKKEIKPLSFIVVDKDHVTYLEPGIYIRGHDTTNTDIGLNLNNIQTYPNNWQVNFGGRPRLVLDADGDMRITGRMHALGSLIWNQELNRLECWDGENWFPIDINR